MLGFGFYGFFLSGGGIHISIFNRLLSRGGNREQIKERPYKVQEKIMDVRYRRVKVNENRMSKEELCSIIKKKKMEKIDDGLYVKKTYESGIVVKVEELKFEYDL